MSNEKFTISDYDDYETAYTYLHIQLYTYKFWHHEANYNTRSNLAKNAFSKLPEPYDTHNFGLMHEFCDNYLSMLQYKKLKTSVKAKRKRKRKQQGYANSLKQVALKPETHLQLKYYAKFHNLTISNAVDILLEIAKHNKAKSNI